MGLFWEMYQTGRILDGERRAESANASIGDLAAQVTDLQQRLDRLTLVTQALFTVLEDRYNVTEADVTNQMEVIAATYRAQTVRKMICPACGHEAAPRHGKCIYCGAQLGADSPFDVR